MSARSSPGVRNAKGDSPPPPRIPRLGVLWRAVAAIRHREQHQRVAEAALRETDRKKSEFLATLAHELRNPLAPIRNSVKKRP